jgi:hypothetical protein
MWWLAAPWRLTTRLLTGIARSLVGHHRGRGQVLVVAGGWAVAVTRALQQGEWTVGGVLTFVGLSAVLCPLAAAAVSRQAEFAADRLPPITASRWSWPPHSTQPTMDGVLPPDGRGGF